MAWHIASTFGVLSPVFFFFAGPLCGCALRVVRGRAELAFIFFQVCCSVRSAFLGGATLRNGLPKSVSFFVTENYTTPCQERVSAACAAANKGTCNNGFRRKKEFFFPPPRRANSLLPSAAPSSLSFFRKKCFFP